MERSPYPDFECFLHLRETIEEIIAKFLFFCPFFATEFSRKKYFSVDVGFRVVFKMHSYISAYSVIRIFQIQPSFFSSFLLFTVLYSTVLYSMDIYFSSKNRRKIIAIDVTVGSY